MSDSSYKNRTLPLSPNLKTGETSDATTIRVRFARRDAAAYVAHLDMMRIFERALRRAGIDCEYSQGFNPRPEMAFALPLGVGVETVDDYVDIIVKGKPSPVEVVAKLKRAMPEGVDIIGAVLAPKTKESMMAQVAAAAYRFVFPSIAKAQKVIRDAPSLMVAKITKGEKKIVDIKPLILSAEIQDENSLKVLVKAGSKENLRPDLLLAALAEAGFFSEKDALAVQIVRIGTFIQEADGKLVRPF